MFKKGAKLVLPVSILLTFMLLFSFSAPVIAQKASTSSTTDNVDVLVVFKGPPGNSDGMALSDGGGKVKRAYHIVPAMAASIPRSKLEALSRNPRVARIDEDVTVQITGQTLPWGVDRVDAEIAQQVNKGTGVKVAVLDTGIDLDHPDLRIAGNVSMLPDFPTADDDNGHGTLVAGIIGALDNDVGVVGIAPEAEIYAVKVLNCYGSGSLSAILAGIEWAVDNQMQVINMSIGSPQDWSVSVIEALNNAYNAGIVIVAGAGNGGNVDGTGDNIWAPGRYEPVIAVGATDEVNKRYSLSCTGATLELMAPGVNVLSTAMGGSYGGISCTSAASPHVTGLAALLIASGITSNVEVRQTLRNMTQELGVAGWDPQYGYGLINASAVGACVTQSDTTAPVTTTIAAEQLVTTTVNPTTDATTTEVTITSDSVTSTTDVQSAVDTSTTVTDEIQPDVETDTASTVEVQPIVETDTTSTTEVDSVTVETNTTDATAPADKNKDKKVNKDMAKEVKKDEKAAQKEVRNTNKGK